MQKKLCVLRAATIVVGMCDMLSADKDSVDCMHVFSWTEKHPNALHVYLFQNNCRVTTEFFVSHEQLYV